MIKWIIVRLSIILVLVIPVMIFWQSKALVDFQLVISAQLGVVLLVVIITIAQFKKVKDESNERQRIWQEKKDHPTLPRGFVKDDKL